MSTTHRNFYRLRFLIPPAMTLAVATGCESTPLQSEDLAERVLSDVPIAGTAPYLPLPTRTLSLTFDDGPDACTLKIAEFLRDEGIRATFFVNSIRFGQPIPYVAGCSQPGTTFGTDILAGLVGMGHRIANHTHDHTDLTSPLTPLQIKNQIKTVQDLLDPYISDGYFLFRAPYGAWNASVANTVRSFPEFNKLVGPMSWDIAGRPDFSGADWACPGEPVSPQACAARYKATIDNPNKANGTKNGIILLHDRNGGAVGTTYALDLVKELVRLLPRPEYLFVPLDAIAGDVFANPPLVWTSVFGNSEGWASDSSRYGSIRLANVDGDPGKRADVCGRDPALGLRCAISNGNGFNAPTTWLSTEYTDAHGWGVEKYGSTIQLADLNGDGKADVCGRGMWGMRCALSTGTGFAPASWWSQGLNFTDSDGWDTGIKYYGTIRLGDVNGDGKADVCGRASWGMVCALSDGQRFGPAGTWSTAFGDATWGASENATTLQLADVNGDARADVCGRGSLGIVCAMATAAGNFANPTLWTPAKGIYSDADGWASAAPLGLSTAASKYRSIDFADINFDGKADVCGRNETGIACALSSVGSVFSAYRYVVHSTFTDATGWGGDYYGTTVQLGDIDGDGRADVCGRGSGGMFCARGLIP